MTTRAVQHDHPSSRAFIRVDPRNEHQAKWMPDDCHDVCFKRGLSSTYYPFHWHDGLAWYLCTEGHLWTCWWSVGQTHGEAPGNAGRAITRYDDEDGGGPA